MSVALSQSLPQAEGFKEFDYGAAGRHAAYRLSQIEMDMLGRLAFVTHITVSQKS
jgi:hypothetical protein